VVQAEDLISPSALKRRELRLAAIAQAKATIEARAAERLARERAKQEQRSGKKPRGRPPEPPTGRVKNSDPVNLTAEDSRIMTVAAAASTSATTRRRPSLAAG
jgi:hypothetical protein